MDLAANLENIRQRIVAACHRAGRAPDSVRLLAVTKSQPPELVVEAAKLGLALFGENKVQELVGKKERLPADIRWHMVGHLQRNKVKFIAPFIHLIHSVDSVALLNEIDRQGGKINRLISCLLQVHIAEEETKFGFDDNEITQLIKSEELHNLKNIRVMGLMGMATFTDDHDLVRREFATLKKIFDVLKSQERPANLKMEYLSMGMSGDYIVALEEGSNMVRIGTAIFGERDYHV